MNRKNWRAFQWLIIASCVFPFAISASPDQKAPIDQSLTIAVIELPPLLGKDKGLLVDLARQAFASQSIKTTFVVYPLSRISWAISKEKHCSTLGSLRWFHETTQKRLTAVPMYNVSAHFFYLKSKYPSGLTPLSSPKFKEYRIGTVRGGAIEKALKAKGLVSNLELVQSMPQNVKKVALNRLDMFASPLLPALHAIEYSYPNKATEFTYSKQRLSLILAQMIFNEQCKDKIVQFERGLHHLHTTGEYKKIIQSYFLGHPVPDYVYIQPVDLEN
ncbi:transporter substrate-binding domain-containing protein [Vibrio profundum]|uniref:substrate-binding periplasmic protein n=1 Tax=Vibrio profundum TaxID=2910247 RepID=UPI003D0F3780